MQKERQLSSYSKNGCYPKKQCEEPFTVHNVFKENLQNPDCLAILLMCLRNLETQINSMFKESEEFKESRIKGDKQLQELNASVMPYFVMPALLFNNCPTLQFFCPTL